MMMDGAAIRGRARAAYERAMVRRGLARLWPLAVLVPVALALHTPATPWRTAVAAMSLGAALLATGWRGGAWARETETGDFRELHALPDHDPRRPAGNSPACALGARRPTFVA